MTIPDHIMASKPARIPDDIWEKAHMLVISVDAAPTDGNIYNIAASILAAVQDEREECAAIAYFMADNCYVEGMTEEQTMAASGVAYDVAEAIRNRSVTEGE